MDNDNSVNSILIVGGGTSGWLCAAYMANMMGKADGGGPEISLMEASDIPTIGVGEATIPPIRSVIAATGLTEKEFIRECNASFKLGIRFDGWSDHAKDGSLHQYYHAFGNLERVGTEQIAPYWIMDDTNLSFVEYAMISHGVLEDFRGPKRSSDPQFSGPLEYAYHFDAGLLTTLLRKRALALGVTHRVDEVTDVTMTEDGSIGAIGTKDGAKLEADLYIDCTGFHARLIEKELNSPFEDVNDVLFCDRAMACQPQYESADSKIPPYTVSTAQKNGWIWDVPLQNRRGVGYVFSSKYCDSDEARETLFQYLGPCAEGIEPRELKFRVGYRPKPWVKNCVAIGLSGGFVEPLESTGIYLTDIAIRWLTDFIVPKNKFHLAADAFNQRMTDCYSDVIDFVKLHYAISNRTDSDFWIENRQAESIPATLRDRLEIWQDRLPSEYEFGHLPAVFSMSNYTQILLGMGHFPDRSQLENRYRKIEAARSVSEQIRKVGQSGVESMPDHRELLKQM